MKPRQIVFRTPRQARDVADAILFIGAEPGTTALDTGPEYEAQAGTIPSGMSFGDQGYVVTDAPMPIVQQIARRLGAEIVPQRHPRTITNRHRPNPPNGLKVGDRFEHKHFLNPETRQPLVGLVTRIAGGIVYYRPDYGLHDDGTPWLGSAAYFPVEQESRWVARIISHRTKRNPMSRKSGLTRAKAREMLDEHDYVSERQRRFLGARASGYAPNPNDVVLLKPLAGGHAERLRISTADAKRLEPLYPLPRMGTEVVVRSTTDSRGRGAVLWLANESGRYFVHSSTTPLVDWADVFGVSVRLDDLKRAQRPNPPDGEAIAYAGHIIRQVGPRRWEILRNEHNVGYEPSQTAALRAVRRLVPSARTYTPTRVTRRNPRSAGSWGVWVVTDGYDNVAVVVAEGEAKARAELREYSKLGRVSLIPIVEGLSKAKAVEAGKRTAARVLGSGYEPHISPRN